MNIKLDSLKKINSGLILHELKNNNFTRVELQKSTGLAAGTLSNIMKELVSKNIVIEKEDSSNISRGRKGTKLFINYDYKHLIAIKIKRGTMIATLNKIDGTVLDKIILVIPQKDPDTIVNLIYNSYEKLKKDKEILGVGISFPGQIDSNEGIITYSSFYGWKKVYLKKMLEEKISCNIFIENDVRAMALSEKDFVSDDIKNILYINIDNGISAGIIINNSLLLGDDFIAGHIGHTFVEDNGIKCNCGKIGCLETTSSIPKIIENYILLSKDSSENINFNYFVEKINSQDKNALKVLEKAVYYIAVVIGNLSNTFNISNIIFGGKILSIDKIFFSLFSNYINKIALPYVAENLKIKKAKFDHTNDTIEAVYVVLNQFYKGNLI